MKTFKLILSIAVLGVLFSALAPIAEAQCVPARSFGTAFGGGAPNGNLRFPPAYPGQDFSNVVGRWWDSGNSGGSNNFSGPGGDPAQSGCPATEAGAARWWSANPMGNFQVVGGIAQNPCNPVNTGCPVSDSLTFLIEDGGPAGSFDGGPTPDSYFLIGQIDETPGALWYDYARIQNGLRALEAFPVMDIQTSDRNGMNVDTDSDFVDIAVNVLSLSAARTLVTEYHVLRATATDDPGKLRSAYDAVPICSIPYDNQAASSMCSVPCTDTIMDSWVAVGLRFDGGSGAPVDSIMVGASQQIECNPSTAEPDQPIQRRDRKFEPTAEKPSTGRDSRSR